jgi:iron complex transport system ATP-binding protein
MLLNVENISFFYESDKIIFDNANFSLDSGQILSIIGPNGAGKSTLLNCIVNLLQPKSGKITIEEKNISQMNAIDISKYIGYVPQIHIPTYGFLVKEYIAMGRAPKIGLFSKPSKEDYFFVEKAMEKMEISHLANKPYTEISGGERQKATIAKVLVQEPKLIILDEPTAYLDYGHQYKTIKLIKMLADEGYAIIMTTHQPEHAILLENYTAIIDCQGEFVFGKTSTIISESLLSDLYKINIKMSFIDSLQKTIVCPVD